MTFLILIKQRKLKDVTQLGASICASHTRELWLQWKEYWPMPGRASSSGEGALELSEDFQIRAERHMSTVIELAAASSVHNAVVIVDPATDRQGTFQFQLLYTLDS